MQSPCARDFLGLDRALFAPSFAPLRRPTGVRFGVKDSTGLQGFSAVFTVENAATALRPASSKWTSRRAPFLRQTGTPKEPLMGYTRAKRLRPLDDIALATELEAAMDGKNLDTLMAEDGQQSAKLFTARSIVTGLVANRDGDDVVIDIGYKAEGYIDSSEFTEEEMTVGTKVQVMIVEIAPSGDLKLSKRQADMELGWLRVLGNNKEGDRVKGKITRKIKGGLLMDIGVPVFLPASQIDLRRTNDVGEFIGQEVEAEIIKIDAERKNIVVSRRKVLEEERRRHRETLVKELQIGELREGVVKNITDFGAFIDLGGLDGLLHITDMSWGRVGHPNEIVQIGLKIEVVVLDYDAERGRISLGLKQKTRNPWEDIEARYAVKSVHNGEVVNIMNYGAFVKLEDGIEGLVHVSEMSWTKTPANPGELVKLGQKVRVMVLEINHEKQEISLGMKQAEKNPWDDIQNRFSIGTRVKGPVTNLTNYGVFLEIEDGIDGLLHVNDISWTKKITHPSSEYKKGDVIECVVLGVDQERQRISLGRKQLEADPWESDIPKKLKKGDVIDGVVAKVTNFGVFVSVLDGLEGLLHVSELPDEMAQNPAEKLEAGTALKVRVLNVDREERKIGLSMKGV
jgi:small subunit ribosomal protein S1